MSENKTQRTIACVDDFLDTIEHPTRKADARKLNKIFQEATNFQPAMWGPSIIGYGQYHYVYKSGREGDMLATGFSPRKANLSLYIMPGYQNMDKVLSRLGKHKRGKACLYINKLDDVDLVVLRELIVTGLTQLRSMWPVLAS
jgi:hypothetical protein